MTGCGKYLYRVCPKCSEVVEELAVLPGDRAAAVHVQVALGVEVEVPGVIVVSIVTGL